MQKLTEAPEMYVFDQGRNKCYGAIKGHTKFTEDIRFGSCSEINLDIPKRYYDIDTCEWVDNPVYDSIKKHNLVYVSDDTMYFSFPERRLATYSAASYNMTDRTSNLTKMTFSQNSGLSNFQLQNETKLFNISIASGYNWQNLSTITSGSYVKGSDWATQFPYVSCTDFVPIQPYDTIAVRSRWAKGAAVTNDYRNTNIKFISYYIHFYSTDEAASYLGTFRVDVNKANPIYRFSVNSLSSSDTTQNAIKKGMVDGGFIRISVLDNFDTSNYANTSYPSYYKVETANSITTTTIAWSFPYDGWLQIYSGERRCTSIANVPSNSNYELPLRWFVIDEVEEDVDGIMPIKTVKLYSYEYTLSWRSTSLSGGTLPLYIPDSIVNRVNSDSWVIDRTTRANSAGDITSIIYGAQFMQRGLLNMILDDLPQWSIGHISSKLMSRYREFDDVDNVGIYTFLMNDVANAYQCYFVFDCENMTISAYTQDDVVQNTNVALNWDNAIKHLKITDSSVNRITALRVHTADDEYGLGLVNPYGGSTIYNFDSVIDQLDFVADTSMNDPLKRNQVLDENDNFIRFRTLKEAVQEMVEFAASPKTDVFYGGYIAPIGNAGIQINNLSDYRKYAKKFVQANMDLVKAKTKYAEVLARYHSIADKINIFLDDDDYENLLPDKPPARLSRSSSDISMYHSRSLYYELAAAVDDYWEAKAEVREGTGSINAGTSSERISVANQTNYYKNLLSHVGQKLNLNYSRQNQLIVKYPDGDVGTNYDELSNSSHDEFSILTPAEILALQPFIVEGDWTNENAVFSDTYGADDIVDTLADVMEQANTDLVNIYSKDNYDFETDTANWTAIEEMQEQAKRIKVGQTIWLGTEPQKWVCPILLELHINYKDDNDFKMTLTTDYNRKPLQFRFADLYGTITQTSVTDSTFTFNE